MTKNAKSKKLTLGQIEKEVDLYSKKEKVQLNEDTHVYIFPHFAPSKIETMIKELLTDSVRAEEEGLEFTVNFTHWAYFSIIKHFADLDIPNEIEKKLKVYAMLIETQYFMKIINSFPKESIEKVTEALKKVEESLSFINAMDEKEKELFIKSFKETLEEEKVSE